MWTIDLCLINWLVLALLTVARIQVAQALWTGLQKPMVYFPADLSVAFAAARAITSDHSRFTEKLAVLRPVHAALRGLWACPLRFAQVAMPKSFETGALERGSSFNYSTT